MAHDVMDSLSTQIQDVALLIPMLDKDSDVLATNAACPTSYLRQDEH